MKLSLLLLLLVRTIQKSAQTPVSVTVSPGLSQFFEYQNLVVSCEPSSSGDWTVWRSSSGEKPVLSPHGFGPIYNLSSIKPSDSGMYWCQSKAGDSSNAVNITVTSKEVILQSPVLPVMEGQNVTLRCKQKSASDLPAYFYKDNNHIRTNPTDHLTLHHVSKADQGAYRCRVQGGESPTSWLLIREDLDPVELSVIPDSSQMFEYQNLDLSCGLNSSSKGWRVIRAPPLQNHELSPCGEVDKWGKVTDSGCFLGTVKGSDSAVYWCESVTKQRSNSVNIKVHAGPVILQSPVRPVMEGQNVTLRCKTNDSSELTADFYKDDNLFRTAPAGHLTLLNVAKSHQGAYRCTTRYGKSPSSWLFVRDSNVTASLSVKVITLLRHLVVVFPYIVCSVQMWRLLCCRPTGRKASVYMTTSPSSRDNEGEDQSNDDVIPAVITEHHF